MCAAGREQNPNVLLAGLVEALLEPVSRRARQEALRAIRGESPTDAV
jgi:hypothetical protein